MKEETADYCKQLFHELERIFGQDQVKSEWDVAKDSGDDFNRDLYCPRLDLAVGPFNITREIDHNTDAITKFISNNNELIKSLVRVAEVQNIDVTDFETRFNHNARCGLAIEVENSGSSKIMLGDLLNASIMGAIGIVVPLNETNRRSFIRLVRFVDFAVKVGKTREIVSNVLIMDAHKFMQILCSTRGLLDRTTSERA